MQQCEGDGKCSKAGEMVGAVGVIIYFCSPATVLAVTCSCRSQMPMVLKMPRFLHSILTVCSERPFSLLGYGDIVVPGASAHIHFLYLLFCIMLFLMLLLMIEIFVDKKFLRTLLTGLLVSYCHLCDLQLGGRRIYYVTTVIGNYLVCNERLCFSIIS